MPEIPDLAEFSRWSGKQVSEDYGLVYSFGVIHHTPNPMNTIESIRRYLSPISGFRLMISARLA